ncbi:DUF190 domain-containing protein [Streptomyces sp. NPDC053086]|uniref:DUF190 domain-containing protein n=1 Tax=unclassified Streptomyces TaxID=2593676 RepID=UPI0037CEDA88
MTSLTGRAPRPAVHLGENDTGHPEPLHSHIVHRAHAAGLAGAGAFRGVEGRGASSRSHASRRPSLSEDLPAAMAVVDAEERVRAFLPQVGEGLATLEDCTVRYGGRAPGPDRTDPEGKRSL